jgi:hypothetical protein
MPQELSGEVRLPAPALFVFNAAAYQELVRVRSKVTGQALRAQIPSTWRTRLGLRIDVAQQSAVIFRRI